MTVRMQFRKQYDIDEDRTERNATNLADFEDTLTIQDAPDTDINDLMRRFGIKDGSELPANLGVADPRYYGDFTDITDFRDSLDRTRDAEWKFMQLPAQLRDRFANDPYKLHTFIHDPRNIEEAVRLGLLHKTAAESTPIATVTRQTVVKEPEALKETPK